MNALKGVILIFVLIFVNNQVPSNYSINSCGVVGYQMPNKSIDCVQENEYCCYVVLKKKESTYEKKFCATAPSKITKQDIEDDIKQYTDYTLETLECNNSKYINIFIGLLLLLFIFF